MANSHSNGARSGNQISSSDLLDPKRIANFWKKVNKTGGGCWIWTAYKNDLGYGVFGVANRRSVLAHRFSYALANGNVEAGFLLRHTCDNPSCVRPDHLIPGTDSENVSDCIARNRKPSFPGESNGRAKLTVVQVAEIRSRYSAGGVRIKDLASEFSVSKSQIWNIVSGEQWSKAKA